MWFLQILSWFPKPCCCILDRLDSRFDCMNLIWCLKVMAMKVADPGKSLQQQFKCYGSKQYSWGSC